MRILIPVLGFGKSGGYRVLSKLANQWVDKGVDVVFLTPKKNSVPYFDTKAKIDVFDVIPIPFGGSLFISLIKMAVLISTKYRYFDAVLANRDLTAFPVFFSKIKSKKAKFYYIQAYEPDFYKERDGSVLKNKILETISRASYFLPLIRVVNSPLYLRYREIKSEYVIPPGIDLSVFYPKNVNGEIKEDFFIGCIGRKQAWKGTSMIADAVEALASRVSKKIKLKIAFELPDDFDLEKYKHIQIDVVQPHGDDLLSDFYRSVDVFIAMGTIQLGGYHYPSIEPLACGVPLISSAYLPANEKNSIQIENLTAESIVESIVQHLNSTSDEVLSRIKNGLSDVAGLKWDMVAGDFYGIILKHKS